MRHKIKGHGDIVHFVGQNLVQCFYTQERKCDTEEMVTAGRRERMVKPLERTT